MSPDAVRLAEVLARQLVVATTYADQLAAELADMRVSVTALIEAAEK